MRPREVAALTDRTCCGFAPRTSDDPRPSRPGACAKAPRQSSRTGHDSTTSRTSSAATAATPPCTSTGSARTSSGTDRPRRQTERVSNRPRRPRPPAPPAPVARPARPTQRTGTLPPNVAVYVTADEYAPAWAARHGLPLAGDLWQRWLLRSHPRQTLLRALAALNRDSFRQGLVGAADMPFLAALPPDLRADIEHVLAGRSGNAPGAPRRLFSRQGILRAVRLVCTAAADNPPPPAGMNSTDPLGAAGMLVHTVADTLRDRRTPGEPRLGGLPQSLAMELVRNQLFHQADDPGDMLARHRRLWRDYGPPAAAATGLRADPWTLLSDTLGAEPDDILALAFALYAHSIAESTPVACNIREHHSIPGPSVDAFLDRFASTADELAAAFPASIGGDNDWDLLPVQDRPLLRDGDNITVLDGVYLLQRVTSGLYWLVHDSEKALGGDPARDTWANTWAHMTEALAEDLLRPLAPDPASYYDEDDFGKAYGGKRADAGIANGDAFVLAEVFSGSPTVKTRVHGDADAFRRDISKMVVEKAAQLDAVATNLLADPQPTGGVVTRPPRRIVPLVIEGAGFPSGPVANTLIREELRRLGYLTQRPVEQVSVLDLADLELLESIRLLNDRPLTVLDEWRGSKHHQHGLRAYIYRRYAGRQLPRPAATQTALDTFTNDVVSRLNLQDDPP